MRGCWGAGGLGEFPLRSVLLQLGCSAHTVGFCRLQPSHLGALVVSLSNLSLIAVVNLPCT